MDDGYDITSNLVVEHTPLRVVDVRADAFATHSSTSVNDDDDDSASA
jgi:hypothetical protein